MAKYVKAPDSFIYVKDKDGKTHQVTERAFNVVYSGKGYTRLDAVETSETDENETVTDYFTLSREELKKITNDKLKAFLDREELDYPSSANKDDLIAIILGEENDGSL